MKIKLRRFGDILTSRPAGREAALAMKAYQRPPADENVELDFEGVLSVGPSWLDEVLSELRDEFGRDRVVCLPTKNPSVIESLKVIDSADE
ncbi:MAG: STAS-like domain-containing protein [Elusimicrobia bacterium]|nr:STAS-like domain-containing protein [Elusimicrobiota bacterium]